LSAVAAALVVSQFRGMCEEPARKNGSTPPQAAASGARELVPVPTLGGVQFWGDELFFHKWRIQRNVVTGHCRLVDEHNLRHAFGPFDHCRAVLDQIKRDRKLPPMKGKAVIVLHGLGDPRSVMSSLCKYLEREGGLEVFNVSYPSTRRSIAEHAEALSGIVANLEGIEEIHFVGFSLGNIVIRRYLAATQAPSGATPSVVGWSRSVPADAAKGKRLDPRIKRFVMLGPPNHGAELATQLRGSGAAKLLLGKPLMGLGEQWPWEELRLGTPPCEFGIIAGGLGNEQGFNPLLPGDDDGIVTVASTRLAGAADFVLVPVFHTFLPRDAKVAEYTLCFLRHGYFVSPERRQPVKDNAD
jgi:pimeloyl-ACP methyl ester carboxylesterase